MEKRYKANLSKNGEVLPEPKRDVFAVKINRNTYVYIPVSLKGNPEAIEQRLKKYR